MAEKQYVNLNGKLLTTDAPVFNFDNRSFRYGDSVFETIRLVDGKLHLFEPHVKRLLQGAEFTKMEVNPKWNAKFFAKEALKLAKKNNVEESARIRLTIYRNDGGLYTPLSNEASYLIEAEGHDKKTYKLNGKGLVVDIYSDMEKSVGAYANYKTANAHLYVMASLYKKDNKLDDCILTNSKNRVAEAISSNIFMVKENEVITPPLTEGCVAGVMRAEILEMFKEMNVTVTEMPIPLEELFTADELFLSNAMHGIRWVSNFKVKEYSLKATKDFSEALDKRIRQ